MTPGKLGARIAAVPSAALDRHERRHAAATLALAALVVGGCIALHRADALRVETALPSLGALLFETAGFVLVFDFYFYALHRLLHTKWLRGVHAVHHASRRPRPLTALSFHPVESLALLVYPALVMAAVPIHLASVCVGGTLLATSITLGHWKREIAPVGWHRTPALRWLATPGVHQEHHRSFDCNFGATTSIPDRLFGTWRVPPATGRSPRAG